MGNKQSFKSSYDSRLTTHDVKWMRRALALASRAEREGEIPVGALLIIDDELMGEGWNRSISSHDPTAHAEIVALREAAESVGNHRLPGSMLYVTLEPCAMCAGAIVQARVARVVYGAADPQAGAAGSVFNLLQSSTLNHCAAVAGGVLGEECAQRLKTFFQPKRQ